MTTTQLGQKEERKTFLGLDWQATRRVLERFAPYLGFYYSRSIADSDTYEFGHSLGFMAGVDVSVMPQLIVSTDVALYQELGEEYERFVLSNWRFGVTRTFNIPYAGVLLPSFYFRLPTNPDDREYLTYRGTVGVDVELRKSNFYFFHKDHAIGGSAGFATARHLYAETTNEAGNFNRLWQVTGYLSLSYKFRRSAMLIAKFYNNLNFSDGGREDDTFRLSVSANYSPIQQLWLAISATSVDKTFLYNQTTPNLAIWSPESTSVIFSVTYLPRLSKTHELNR